jgi:hypothetical protein
MILILFKKIPSFIKLPNYKKFEYRPRYYNEAKEKMEKRYKKFEKEKDTDESSLFREKIREKWSRGSYSSGVKNYNRRILIILFIVALILWYIFK